MREVVVTGLGAVTSLGVGVDRFWTRLLAGESGLRPMQRLDATGLRNTLAGEVPEEEWAATAGAGPLPRYVSYAITAVSEALGMAGLTSAWADWPGAVILGTNFGAQGDIWDAGEYYPQSLSLDLAMAALAPGAGSVAPRTTLSNACSTGTQVVGHAADLIRLGLCETAIAVASDELGLFCLSGLSILHTISTDTLRPFDVNRSGTIFAEGAAALILESSEHAAARGAQPFAKVLGYGVNNNAWHLTAPDKGGEGMVAVIREALRQAAVTPDQIGHVNAHATGTEHHDPAETAAIKTVLGAHAYHVPVSAIKGATGHAMGAAGAIEAVACVLALRDQVAPPTINLEQPDPLCDLDYCRGAAQPASFDTVLSVSAGLGGNNAAVLFGRA